MDHSPPSYRKWLVVLVPCLGQFSVGLAVSAVIVAIPTMMGHLSASLGQIHWVVTGYMITRTVLLPSVGWLGGRLGNRNLFLLGIAAFTSGSFLCAISWNVSSLVFFRIIQAIGAGPLQGVSLAIVFEAFPVEQRGLAASLISVSRSLSIYLGPPAGGFLAEKFHWRAIFYGNMVLGIFAILGAYFVFPRTSSDPEKKGGTFDLVGFATLTIGVASFLLATSQGRELGWTSPLVIGLFVTSLVLLPVFVLAELRAKNPYVELRYFRNLNFGVANLLNFTRAAAFRGADFLLSFFIQKGLNYSPLKAGMLLLPGAVVAGIAAPASGTISDRLGPRVPIVCAFAILTLASYSFSSITVWTGIASILFFIGLFGLGVAILNPPLNALCLRAVSEGKSRLVTGTIGLIRETGQSFGIVIITFFLERQSILNLGSMTALRDAHLSEGLRQKTFFRLRHLMLQAGNHRAALQTHSTSLLSYFLLNEAVTQAYQHLFLGVALLYLLLLVASALFVPSSGKKAQPETTEQPPVAAAQGR